MFHRSEGKLILQMFTTVSPLHDLSKDLEEGEGTEGLVNKTDKSWNAQQKKQLIM